MEFEIKRFDRAIYEITTQSFQIFDEAYDLLSNIYEDISCSDADYDNRTYYAIIKIKNFSK